MRLWNTKKNQKAKIVRQYRVEKGNVVQKSLTAMANLDHGDASKKAKSEDEVNQEEKWEKDQETKEEEDGKERNSREKNELASRRGYACPSSTSRDERWSELA